MAVPLIGQGETTSENPEFANLSDEERERLVQMAEEHPEDVDEYIPVTTAFLVVVDRDGQVIASPDVTAKVAPDRTATPDDVIAACTVAVSNANAAKNAQATAFQMAQVGQMMQAQQREAAEAARIKQLMAENQGRGFKHL